MYCIFSGLGNSLTIDIDLLITDLEALPWETDTALDIVVTTIYGAIDDLTELSSITPHGITTISSTQRVVVGVRHY